MKVRPLKGRGLSHVTIFEFLAPLYIFRTTKDRNLVFGAETDHGMCYPIRDKLTPKVGVVRVT